MISAVGTIKAELQRLKVAGNPQFLAAEGALPVGINAGIIASAA